MLRALYHLCWMTVWLVLPEERAKRMCLRAVRRA